MKNSWNADLYNNKHNFVSEYGLELVDLLDPKTGERILDLGCGTGILTGEISKRKASVVGLDRSSSMIERAKIDFPQIEFIVGDGQDFHFAQKFDAVFSNAALHWMLEPQKVISCILDSLKEGGRFIAEFGGKGNVEILLRSISEVIEHDMKIQAEPNLTNYFPSLGEYATLLEAQGFRVLQAFHFNRWTALSDGELGLRNWIKMFRSFLLKGLSEKEQERLLAQVEEKAKEHLYQKGVWYADYKRLRIQALKEK